MAFGDPDAIGGDQATGGGGMGSADAEPADFGKTVADVMAKGVSDQKAFTDAEYSHKGWEPGKALTYTDEQGKTQLATLEAHESRMDLPDLESLRQEAYAAKAAQPGINTPVGKITVDTVAKAAFSAISPAAGIGGIVTAGLDKIGLPNVGPFMDREDRNWDDARWSDHFDPIIAQTWDNYRYDPSDIGVPSSPAGGEILPRAPGAYDPRVSQFKSQYPQEWTAFLSDQEIIEMIENPDQLRYWLSWRQS